MKIIKNNIYRNSNIVEIDKFNKLFSDFDDKKGIINCGGFRAKSRINGSTDICSCAFTVLVSNFKEKEWPNKIINNSEVIYYGDNRKPNNNILNTKFKGNKLLAYINQMLMENKRVLIPPILMFESFKEEGASYMRFIGLLSPSVDEDFLEVETRKVEGGIYSNYKAKFNIMKTNEIDINWLKDLVRGEISINSEYCPESWREFVDISSSYSEVAVDEDFEEDEIITQKLNIDDISFKIPTFNYNYDLLDLNFDSVNESKKAIGNNGEELVIELEKERLYGLNLKELALNIKWISKLEGNLKGYDILSFKENKEKLYIEVKSTTKGIEEQFCISDRELTFAEKNKNNWLLYRVYIKGGKISKYYTIGYDELIQKFNLKPTEYTCYFKKE